MRAAPLPLLGLLLLAACGGETAPLVPWRGEDNLVEITLDDIHCDGCEVEIQEALGPVEGVASVVADHESNLVLITLRTDADRDASIARLRDAIHAGGRRIVGEDPVP